MEIRFCYQVLEISPGTSLPELKQAYKDLVQVWHPDRFSHNPRLQAKAVHKLTQINEAYEILGNTLAARERLRAQFAKAENSGHQESAQGPTSRRQTTHQTTTDAVESQSASPHASAQTESAQSSHRATGRNADVRNRYTNYRGHPYRRHWSARWLFSVIAMSLGIILLMFTPFVIAYAIAQQPGLFLLPAVALVGVYGYRVLRIT